MELSPLDSELRGAFYVGKFRGLTKCLLGGKEG